MIERLRHHLTGEIAKSAICTFGLKGFHTGMMFVVSFGLARLLGPDGYGAYAFAMSTIILLSVPSTLGLEGLLVRDIAAYRVQAKWDLLKGLLQHANQTTFIVSLLLTGVAYFASFWLADHVEPEMVETLWVALPILPFLAHLRIRQAIMQGLQRIVAAQISDMFVHPVLFAVALAIVVLIFSQHFDASAATGLRAGVTAISCIVAITLCQRILPQQVNLASPSFRKSEWTRHGLPILWFNAVNVFSAQMGIFLVGIIKGAEFTGMYSIVLIMANLMTFALQAVNMPLAPMISKLYVANDLETLQRLITKAARAALLAALLIGVAFFIAGDWLLSIIHPRYADGFAALMLLALGQVLNAAFGSVGTILIMTGDQKGPAIAISVAAGIAFSLNLLLIPVWGIEGAAVASIVDVLVWNVVLSVRVRHKLGLHSTALGATLSN